MSIRNYNAFIKAARKKGGLSLPSARKVYHKVKARLGEPPKGTDVKKHPRIFKESLTAKDRTRAIRSGLFARSKRVTAKKSTAGVGTKKTAGSQRSNSGAVRTTGKKPGIARSGKRSVGVSVPRSRAGRLKRAPAPAPAPVPRNFEYAASSDYKQLRVQVHVKSTGRALTHKEISAAADAWMKRAPLPAGVEVMGISYANGRKDFTKETNPRRARIIAQNLGRVGLEFK